MRYDESPSDDMSSSAHARRTAAPLGAMTKHPCLASALMSWCAASAVLNHGAVAPSSRAARTRVPTSMQLVLLEHSMAQSSVGLCREMIVRAVERSCPVVVVCVQRQPQLYPSGVGVHIIDYHYRSVHDGMSLAQVERSILAAVDKLAQHTRMTVVLDSLDALVESTQCSDRAAYAFVRRLLSFLPRFSRVVLGHDGDPNASAASLVPSLRCPQLWVGIQPMHDVLSGPPWTHATLSVRVHTAAFVRYIQETYGLAPPASHASLRRAPTKTRSSHTPSMTPCRQIRRQICGSGPSCTMPHAAAHGACWTSPAAQAGGARRRLDGRVSRQALHGRTRSQS